MFPTVPKELKQLLKSLPGVAVNSISYTELLKSMVITGKQFLAKELPAEMFAEIQGLLPQNIQLSKAKPEKAASDIGDEVLVIYFAQLQSTKGIFLDLSASRFYQDESLVWSPSPLWHNFDPGFLTGLRGLYEGYYLEDEKLFMECLDSLGLTAGCNEQESKEIRDLFYSHFGSNTEEVEFSFQKFSDSFAKIFEFLNRKKIKVSTDFVYLGLYLTSLYKHLTSYDHAFNVKGAYLKSRELAAAPIREAERLT